MTAAAKIATQTARWIERVIIKHNFCPFAAPEVKRRGIHYQVSDATENSAALTQLLAEWERLDAQESIRTSFLIFPSFLNDFNDYLDFLFVAENLLQTAGYEGIYQLASFHPDYQFAQSDFDDPANFTNRSPYPMLHILREDMLEEALKNFPHPENIPNNNIKKARKLGNEILRATLKECLEEEE